MPARILPALTVLLAAGPAAGFDPMADAWCAGRETVVQALTVRGGAVMQGQGLRDPETVVELWTGRDGTWTMVMTYADGRTCVVAMGEDWIVLDKTPS